MYVTPRGNFLFKHVLSLFVSPNGITKAVQARKTPLLFQPNIFTQTSSTLYSQLYDPELCSQVMSYTFSHAELGNV